MKDYLFFPLIFIAALAIIAAAALPGKDRLGCSSVSGAISGYQRVSLRENDLCRMVTVGQADIERVIKDDKIKSVLIGTGAGLLSDRADRNPHFPLSADLEQAFAGRSVRVTIEARSAEERGATFFEASYFAGQEGGSGWEKFTLTPEYRTYSFTWDVPPRLVCEKAIDYVSIRPVVPDKTRVVEIRGVDIEPFGPLTPPTLDCSK